MTDFRSLIFTIFLSGVVLSVNSDSNFAGSAITSDSGGTRSILVTSKNGPGGGVIQTRNGGGGISVGSFSGSPSVRTYVSPGGGAGAFAGPAGAYASAGNAYAGPINFDPYSNGAYAGSPDYYPPYNPYSYGDEENYADGNQRGVGVYSSSDGNGIQSRFASLGPGGRATIVEQTGNEPPRVYTYRGSVNFPETREN